MRETFPSFIEQQSIEEKIEANKETFVGAYAPFEPAVGELKELVASERLDEADQRFNCIGESGGLYAYCLPSENGSEAVIRVNKNLPIDLSRLDPQVYNMERIQEARRSQFGKRVTALAMGLGMECLEQGIAVSYEEEIVITERAPGRHMQQLSAEELACVSEAQLEKLANIFETMNAANLSPDLFAKNIFYHPEKGFFLIDYNVWEGRLNTTKAYVEFLENFRAFVKSEETRDISEQIFIQGAIILKDFYPNNRNTSDNYDALMRRHTATWA